MLAGRNREGSSKERILQYKSDPALPPVQKLILLFLGYYCQSTFCREPPDKAASGQRAFNHAQPLAG